MTALFGLWLSLSLTLEYIFAGYSQCVATVDQYVLKVKEKIKNQTVNTSWKNHGWEQNLINEIPGVNLFVRISTENNF